MKYKCSKCKIIKDITEFHFRKNRKKGIQSRCKICLNLTVKSYRDKHIEAIRYIKRTWYKNNKEKVKNHLLKSLYGISLDTYNELAKLQNYQCAICTRKAKLVVDHNHINNAIRGLLCTNCNTMLGLAHDNKTTLIKAVSYLTGKTNG